MVVIFSSTSIMTRWSHSPDGRFRQRGADLVLGRSLRRPTESLTQREALFARVDVEVKVVEVSAVVVRREDHVEEPLLRCVADDGPQRVGRFRAVCWRASFAANRGADTAVPVVFDVEVGAVREDDLTDVYG